MKENLKRIKKQSIIIINLSLIVTLFGIKQYYEADEALLKLDQGKLDEMELK